MAVGTRTFYPQQTENVPRAAIPDQVDGYSRSMSCRRPSGSVGAVLTPDGLVLLLSATRGMTAEIHNTRNIQLQKSFPFFFFKTLDLPA